MCYEKWLRKKLLELNIFVGGNPLQENIKELAWGRFLFIEDVES